jgi:hypothetical protein
VDERTSIALVVAITEKGAAAEVETHRELAVLGCDFGDDLRLRGVTGDRAEGGADLALLHPHGLVVAEANEEIAERGRRRASSGLRFEGENGDPFAVEEAADDPMHRIELAPEAGTPTKIERASEADASSPIEDDERHATEAGSRDGEDRKERRPDQRYGKARRAVFGDGAKRGGVGVVVVGRMDRLLSWGLFYFCSTPCWNDTGRRDLGKGAHCPRPAPPCDGDISIGIVHSRRGREGPPARPLRQERHRL